MILTSHRSMFRSFVVQAAFISGTCTHAHGFLSIISTNWAVGFPRHFPPRRNSPVLHNTPANVPCFVHTRPACSNGKLTAQGVVLLSSAISCSKKEPVTCKENIHPNHKTLIRTISINTNTNTTRQAASTAIIAT